MKWITASLIGGLWLPYMALIPAPAGNPNRDAYIGQAGSTYDAAANPPQTIGTVSYNPFAPLAAAANAPQGNGANGGAGLPN